MDGVQDGGVTRWSNANVTPLKSPLSHVFLHAKNGKHIERTEDFVTGATVRTSKKLVFKCYRVHYVTAARRRTTTLT